MAASPAYLRGGFRPFFLAGAAWAVLALSAWLLILTQAITLPIAVDPLAWHRHEMLFGFVGAVVAGFLLTAIPNWTGRLPIAGGPLAAFVGLWVAARAAMFFSGEAWFWAKVGLATAALLDVGFLLVLAAIAGREVIAANNRNRPVVGIVLLLAIASALDHAAMAGAIADETIGVRLGVGTITVLISLIGGRLVPSFTRNWLARQDGHGSLPTQPGRFDLVSIGVTVAAVIAWVVFPGAWAVGALLLLAGALQLARLARWQGYRTIADPLVAMLHLAYLWIPIGLALLGASVLGASGVGFDVGGLGVSQSGAIHALTVGAMGSMILAVMTRATLGHTGRELKADRSTKALYGAITLAAIARVAASFAGEHYSAMVNASGLLWIAAFGLFLWNYGPMLIRPRKGEAG